MAGNQQPLKHDFKDPFNAGQLLGMLTILTFIENNNGIPIRVVNNLKDITAETLQDYFDKPTEDIHLMINDLIKEIPELQ